MVFSIGILLFSVGSVFERLGGDMATIKLSIILLIIVLNTI